MFLWPVAAIADDPETTLEQWSVSAFEGTHGALDEDQSVRHRLVNIHRRGCSAAPCVGARGATNRCSAKPTGRSMLKALSIR
jgi:hypothetical protein